jgi:hypothetical protein
MIYDVDLSCTTHTSYRLFFNSIRSTLFSRKALFTYVYFNLLVFPFVNGAQVCLFYLFVGFQHDHYSAHKGKN